MSYTISIPYKESADFSTTGNANFTGTSLELAKEDKLISEPGDLTSPTDPNMEYVDGELQSKNIYGVDNEITCVWDSVTTENFSSVLPAFKFMNGTIIGGYADFTGGSGSFSNDLFVGKTNYCWEQKFRIDRDLGGIGGNIFFIRYLETAKYMKLLFNNTNFSFRIKADDGTEFTANAVLPTNDVGYEFDLACEYVPFDGVNDGSITIYLNGVPTTKAVNKTLTTADFTAMYFTQQEFFQVKNFRYQNEIKYAGASYTPESTLPEFPFVESNTEVLNDTYEGVGTVQSFAGLTVGTAVGAKFSVNNMYWNGSAWAVSDNTYTQSSTLADINANAATLPVTDDYFLSVALANGSTKSHIDSVSFNYNGQKFADAISATYNASFPASEFNSFSAFLSTPSSYTTVTFAFLIGSTIYWHNGSSWVVANGTVAESNTLAQVQAAITELDQTGLFKLVTFLESNDEPSGYQNPISPSITLSVVDITFEIPGLTVPSECLVYGLDRNTCTEPVTNGEYTNVGDVQYSIVFENPKTFMHDSVAIRKSVCEIVTSGSFAVIASSFYETETLRDLPTAGDTYKYKVSMRKKTKILLKGVLTDSIEDDVLGYCEMPNLNEVLITDLVFSDTPGTNS